MPKTESTAAARVTVTLEIDPGSTWGHNCALDQIYKQAGTEAINMLERIIQEAKATRSIRIIGKPTVSAIITKEA